MGKLYFDLSTRTPEQIAAIVSAVPENWCWLDGRLLAPAALVESGQAHADSGYILGGFSEGAVEMASKKSRTEEGSRPRADIHGLICKNVLPAFIGFFEAGYRQSSTLPLFQVIRIAADYVARGYESSDLTFFSGFHDNSKYENPERAEFHLQPWRDYMPFRGPELAPLATRPPMVALSWDARFGGAYEHLRPLIAACEAQGARFLGDTPDGWAQQTNAVVTA